MHIKSHVVGLSYTLPKAQIFDIKVNMHIAHPFLLLVFIACCSCWMGATLSNVQGFLFHHLPRQISTHVVALAVGKRLPIFVYDLKHDWVENPANLAWLERQWDTNRDLCFESNAGGKELHSRSIPSDLFERLDIDNNRYALPLANQVDRRAWVNFRNRLQEIKECPKALQQVTFLHMDIYPKENDFADLSEEVIELFADVLSSMPNLQHIRWGLPSAANAAIEKVFTRREVQLMNVTNLTAGSMGHFMISVCPNIETLSGGSYSHHWSWTDRSNWESNSSMALIRATSGAKKLTHFHIHRDRRYWSPEVVRGW